MSGIPKLFLRKTFVRNSCKNVDDNTFVFQLRNPIGSGTVTEIFYLKLNGEVIPIEKILCYRENEGPETKISILDINAENPFLMDHQGTVNFTVKGFQLEQGDNTLELSFHTIEVGKVEFDVKVKA
ncbi:MAG: hypothetical protein ACXAEU_22695 [Candidatus Hodarchaeales archaeon]|jgi:hypothetical protein